MSINPQPKGPTRREAVMTLLGAPACVIAAQARADAGAPDKEARIERLLSGLLPPVSVEGEAPAKLADRMKALHVPGMSIAVMHDGAIDWARGFGTTGKGDAKASDETLFQAASVSKPVTAVAALALVQARRLDLGTDVDTYLKSWKLPPTPLTREEQVTLRRLLNHTAGVTLHGFDGYVPGAAIPNLLEILNGLPPANSPPIVIDTIPGTQFRYSGGGYTIMQQILNDATGQPFADFLKETVLAPSGMTHSCFDQPLPGKRATDAALPHDGKGNALAGGPISIRNLRQPACGPRPRIWLVSRSHCAMPGRENRPRFCRRPSRGKCSRQALDITASVCWWKESHQMSVSPTRARTPAINA